MAETVGQHSVAAFTSPVNGTSPIDANTVKGNDNTIRSAYVDHDADPGIHVQSSTLASRPTANSAGRKWMTADSGVIRLFYDDGTNWYEADYLRTTGGTISGNLSVTGTLGVTGVTTLTAQPILSSLTASQAVFTDASKGLVSNAITGTGNVVMSASPTLTGTIQAAAATLSGALGVSGLLTFASLKGTGATTVTNILDEDNMASDSATALATQQSIKAYVDAQVGASDALSEVLAIGNTTGANDIIVSTGQKIRTPAVAAGDGSPAITIANTTGALTLAAALADSNLATISTAGKVANSATTATDANTASAIVARDASGNFSAGTITAALTGNASTATALQTARTINGTSFDGTANITVTAAAGTLTGTTLASNVVSSSLTSVGTLANLTVTNPISGSVTGSSGSTTGNAATATALQTARNINGVSFNGTADITVTAAAGTLTGTTLASGVTASSLTSVGTLTSLTVSGNTSLASSSGGVGIGVAAGSSKLNVAGTFTKNTGDENTWGIRVTDDTAMTTGVGGGLVFVGNYTSGGGKASFASIAGAKANSTTANGLGELRFYTTDASSILQQRAVIDGAGNLAVDTNTLYVDAANNRVGVGTATPGSPLHVLGSSGAVSRTSVGANANQVYHQIDNSVNTLEAGVLAAGNAYLSSNGAYAIAFSTNGTEKMRLDASGNLGLGVTPSAWTVFKVLQGQRSAFASYSDGSPNAATVVSTNAFYNGSWKYIESIAAASYEQATSPSAAHKWFVAPTGTAGNAITFTQAMTLDASGYLGIGTTSPDGRIYASETTNGLAYFTFRNPSTGGSAIARLRVGNSGSENAFTIDVHGSSHATLANVTRIFNQFTAPLVLGTDGAERARITAGGDFCVNATSGNGRLSVRGPGTTTGYSFEAANSAGTTRFIVQDGGLIQFLSNTSGTESGRFTTGGYFKASNDGTYFSSAGSQHELRSSSSANTTFILSNPASSFAADMMYINVGNSSGTGFNLINADTSAGGQFRVRGDGTIYAQNTTVQSISDARLKDNVTDATDGLAVITALRPVRYDWKAGYGNDRKNQLGFIAQEMEAVFPEAVSDWSMDEPTGEVDEDGKPITEKVDYKTVGPGALIPVLVKAIQEQQAMIEALEARLEALEA